MQQAFSLFVTVRLSCWNLILGCCNDLVRQMSQVVFSKKTRVSVLQRTSSVVSMLCVSGMQVGRPLTFRVKCVICCIYIRCKDRTFWSLIGSFFINQ